ncbi:hypothetical protein EB796_004558 [Bugula neritina]|uniref:Ribosomal protein n=1 Tax=Bugula neritina TaxID=10212 RepID=A0A7J7KET0_BUGNE|nr:hypothetical protein EB796_004558 [Bugula neritina]
MRSNAKVHESCCRMLKVFQHGLRMLSAAWNPSSHMINSQKMLPLLSSTQTRCYKVAVSLERRCKDCYFVRRGGRLYMECKKHGRHKTMQKLSKSKYQLYFTDKPWWS